MLFTYQASCNKSMQCYQLYDVFNILYMGLWERQFNQHIQEGSCGHFVGRKCLVVGLSGSCCLLRFCIRRRGVNCDGFALKDTEEGDETFLTHEGRKRQRMSSTCDKCRVTNRSTETSAGSDDSGCCRSQVITPGSQENKDSASFVFSSSQKNDDNEDDENEVRRFSSPLDLP